MTMRTCRCIGRDDRAAVHLMSQLYSLATRETPPIVMVNPFAGLELPTIRPHEAEFLEHDEADALFTAAGEIGPRWRTLIELGTEVGLRPGELYGLHGHRVDWLRGKIQVVDVMTRTGLRQWPKSKKSHRVVPVPPTSWRDVGADDRAPARRPGVHRAGRRSGDDGNFRDRVWYPAVAAAGIRRFPPRIMRHTAARWLVLDGVPLLRRPGAARATRTTRRRSGTPTSRRTPTARSSSRGNGGVTHQ